MWFSLPKGGHDQSTRKLHSVRDRDGGKRCGGRYMEVSITAWTDDFCTDA